MSKERWNGLSFTSMGNILLFFASLLLIQCSKLTMNNPCDPSAKDYAVGLVYKMVTSDRKTFCEINIKNDVSVESSCRTCRIFVTADPYSGALGGIAGADNKCNIDGNKPNTGIYKAFLSDSIARWACITANCSGGPSEHQNWVLQPNKDYVRATSLIPIGTTNSNGLLLTQTNAVTTTGVTTWLGFRSNWITEPSLHCDDWIQGTNTFTGTLNDQSTNPIIGAASNLCNNSHSLVCVEQ
ncbi:DUF1554 domain-containing protein [Leptospira perdikensis]|uniref:DUF1554 domain-containing protein n=1 Tax=Leptospira perdikensis TaxID=2484948 RepID=A0A4R9JLQ7_9LEPT|nr:DUF1554 domain-containing protein [Leptospira perdikensis]TGL45600.1 DUF1554 domain-containing protein [Leptospira perdikensis]